MGVKHRILKTLTAIENRYDHAKFKRRQRRGLGTLMIVPYVGYGTPDEFFVKGRVLRDKNINPPMNDASLITNLVDTYKRFQSDEIPGAVVRASFGGSSAEIVTNEEGFFEFHLKPGALQPTPDHTYLVDLEIADYPGKALNPAEPAAFTAQAQVIVPPPGAEFGVISDIDDTVLRSDVSHWLVLARNTFFENAHTRLPFEGVAKFYQALRRGASGANFNPVFYVSSSAWNMYDVLYDFFVVREIPVGALFLTEYNLDENTFIIQNQRQHKLDAIETVLRAYPDLPFVLIGDSSERDPVIYREIVERYRQRIKTVYIRVADMSRRRSERTQAIVAEIEALDIPILLASDSFDAAQHAVDHGLIHPDALHDILAEREKDLHAATPLQQALNLPPTPDADAQ